MGALSSAELYYRYAKESLLEHRIGVVGLFVAEKQTYWLPGTYLRDIETCSIAIIGCAVAEFALGCIVERANDERQRRMKLFYWLVVMAVLGSLIGLGKGVPARTTVTVFACTLSVGLVVGTLQYFAKSR